MRSGKVDCEADRDFCRELRVTAYPTVMLFLSPEERYEISSQVPSEILERIKSLIGEKKEKHYVHDEF